LRAPAIGHRDFALEFTPCDKLKGNSPLEEIPVAATQACLKQLDECVVLAQIKFSAFIQLSAKLGIAS